VVKQVAPGSPAAWRDFRPGDVILKISEFDTRNLTELESVLNSLLSGRTQKASPLEIDIARHSGHRPGTYRKYFTLPTLASDGEAPVANPEKAAGRMLPKQSRETNRSSRTQPAPPAWPTPPIQPAAPQTQFSPPTQTQPNSDDSSRSDSNSLNDASPVAQQLPNRDSMRFDGKSFEEWRALWQNELDTESRSSALRALAAFARAGYGAEVADAILDVAEEYDFTEDESSIPNNPDNRLKAEIRDVLVPTEGKQTLARYWVPELVRRLKSDPEKWTSFATEAFRWLRRPDTTVAEALRPLAKDTSLHTSLRAAALNASGRQWKSPVELSVLDEETREIIDEWLASDDPTLLNTAMSLLVQVPSYPAPVADVPRPRLVAPDQLARLLLHPNENVQRIARATMNYLRPEDAPPIVAAIVGKLSDASLSKKDQLAAVRALAALGPLAKDSYQSLKASPLFEKEPTDEELGNALVVAIARMSLGEPEGYDLKKVLEDPKARAELEKVDPSLIPEPAE
jgi:hypothetical protein